MIIPSGIRHPCIRDAVGRTVTQVENQGILASGKETFKNNSTFFVRLSYEDLRMVDLDRAGLYPFIIAASGNTTDLSAVDCLLRRDPSLAYGGERINQQL